MDQIFAAFVGGLLAAGTGVFLQNRQQASQQQVLKQHLMKAMKDDLNLAIILYEKTIDEWDKSKTVWFTTLNELFESRISVTNNRDSFVLFNDDGFRMKVFKYYNKSFQQLSSLQNLQQQKYGIESKFNELVRDLRIKDARLNRESAIKTANDLMPNENDNLTSINQRLPGDILKIKDLIIEAKEIQSKLPDEI